MDWCYWCCFCSTSNTIYITVWCRIGWPMVSENPEVHVEIASLQQVIYPRGWKFINSSRESCTFGTILQYQCGFFTNPIRSPYLLFCDPEFRCFDNYFLMVETVPQEGNIWPVIIQVTWSAYMERKTTGIFPLWFSNDVHHVPNGSKFHLKYFFSNISFKWLTIYRTRWNICVGIRPELL